MVWGIYGVFNFVIIDLLNKISLGIWWKGFNFKNFYILVLRVFFVLLVFSRWLVEINRGYFFFCCYVCGDVKELIR